MSESLTVMTSGFITSISLIMAIGAQNAFVLSQGIKKKFNFEIAMTCCSIDALLIFAGIAGMGLLISSSPILMWCIAVFGAVFLTGYGLKAFMSAFSEQKMVAESQGIQTVGKALAITVSITLLNPHVYLDTVVLIGSVGGQYGAPDRWLFAVGATLASVIWFFSLSFGAAKLAPLFERPMAWRVLDILVCAMMWAIAFSLWTLVFEKMPFE
ncbi:LysE/ArgO family amino acid transporter [Litoribacillus peritrichatus]|uniref:LysE/ArgO family amino acid transporter n=1 Tax=Litoribacillus peritrichatus TaxID=718191 RepID=A0ABP7MYH6_9GAMM